jgi:hypothetical protein
MENHIESKSLRMEHYYTEDEEVIVVYDSEEPLGWIKSDTYTNVKNML